MILLPKLDVMKGCAERKKKKYIEKLNQLDLSLCYNHELFSENIATHERSLEMTPPERRLEFEVSILFQALGYDVELDPRIEGVTFDMTTENQANIR